MIHKIKRAQEKRHGKWDNDHKKCGLHGLWTRWPINFVKLLARFFYIIDESGEHASIIIIIASTPPSKH